MTRREKNATIKCLKELHTNQCPLIRTPAQDIGPMNCACMIAVVYRLLDDTEVEPTQ